jgi:hypothetical protein
MTDREAWPNLGYASRGEEVRPYLDRILAKCPSSNALRQFTALLSGGSSSPVGLS